MAWTRVQHNSMQSGNLATQRTLAFGSNNTAGNLLCVIISTFNAGITLTVTDTAGNTYSQAGTYVVNGSVRCSIWYVSSCLGGANTVQITPSATAFMDFVIVEYGGDGAGATVDSASASATGSGTSASCGTVPVNGTNEMVLVGGGASSGAVGSAGGSFTMFDQQSSSTGSPVYAEDQFPLSSGVSGDFTLSISRSWAALGVSFKPAVVATAQIWPYLDTGLCGSFCDMGMGGL